MCVCVCVSYASFAARADLAACAPAAKALLAATAHASPKVRVLAVAVPGIINAADEDLQAGFCRDALAFSPS